MMTYVQRFGLGAAALATLSVSAWAEPDMALLKRAMDGQSPNNVIGSPVDGLYQFNIGSEVFYLSKDGRYLLRGELIDLKSRENLTEQNRAKARLDSLAKIKKDDMIIFPAKKGKKQHIVYVFTDIDCGYCRMLHENIGSYNDQGIEIRYLSFPRAGIGSESYDKAVSVWCSKDRQKALTDAKRGIEVDSANCAAPVREQYNIGIAMGINGTPAMVLEDGTLIPGFVKPANLVNILNEHAKGKK